MSTGKAFEYATAMSFYIHVNHQGGQVQIVNDIYFQNVKSSFDALGVNDKNNLMSAAMSAALEVFNLEKNLQDMTNNLIIRIAPDSYGEIGDVRDVILTKDDWEIGISCKHNHQALKHQRLSNRIDFGNEWAGYPVSQNYWQNVQPIFQMLQTYRNGGVNWRDLPNYGISKEQDVYIPLLNTFLNEFNQLDEEHSDLATRFMEYLAGRKDFYKFVMDRNHRVVTIYCYNLHGDSGIGGAVPFVPLPTNFISKSWKVNINGSQSTNTLIIEMNHNWTVGLRLHSAASLVETSLKFDSQPIQIPNSLLTIQIPY